MALIKGKPWLSMSEHISQIKIMPPALLPRLATAMLPGAELWFRSVLCLNPSSWFVLLQTSTKVCSSLTVYQQNQRRSAVPAMCLFAMCTNPWFGLMLYANWGHVDESGIYLSQSKMGLRDSKKQI